MKYWVKRKIWQIKNVIRWLPIIWKQYDFDYSYAIEVFKFQLQNIANRLESDTAMTLSANDRAKRLNTIIELMNKVYDGDYEMEYMDQIEKIYGKDAFIHKFIKCKDKEGFSELKYNYELTESKEKQKEISKVKRELSLKSDKKQKKAHKLLWNLIEHNIQTFWD